MSFNQEEARNKLFDAIDPNIEYSMDDFNKEYNQAKSQALDGFKIPLKFENRSNNEDPDYAKDGDSGFDVRAYVDETVSLMPTRLSVRKDGKNVTGVELIHGETKIIPTGLFFEIPNGYEIQVRSRSGLSAKAQVVVTNSPGTVDSGYRGELKIILTNHGEEVFHINNGDRIAQCVFATVLTNQLVKLTKVDEISKETERGSGGFGSTGTN